jgi:uncharacterized protein (TIGR03085 family)
MSVVAKERAALADLFDKVGPDEPTRCEGWDTEDLLIHLLVRERRADAQPGLYLSFAKPWTDKVKGDFRARGWSELVKEFRGGPGRLNPVSWGPVDELINAGEYFIHHEDVRRGRPGWEPRKLDEETTRYLDKGVRSAYLRYSVRKAGVGVAAVLPGGDRVELRKGEPEAIVTGEPGEILIWSSGRPAARVEITGDAGAVAALDRVGLRVDPSL